MASIGGEEKLLFMALLEIVVMGAGLFLLARGLLTWLLPSLGQFGHHLQCAQMLQLTQEEFDKL